MNKIYGKLLLLLSLFLWNVNGRAQDNAFDINVSTPSELTVLHDNEYSNFTYFDLDLKLEHDIDSASTDVKARLAFTDPEQKSFEKIMIVQTEGKHVTATSELAVMESGVYTVTCRLSWTTKEGESKTAESQKTLETHIYESPEATADPYKTVVFEGNQQIMQVHTTGGYENGWEHEWSTGETSTSVVYTAALQGNPGTNDSRNEILLTSKNYGPDGKTVWYTVESHFPVHVWKKPSYTMSQEKFFDIVGKDALKLGVKVSGGDPSAWTYAWTLDEQSLGSTAEVTKQLSATATHQYKLVLKNAPEGMDEADCYSAEETGTVYYWEEVEVTDLCDESVVLLSGSSQTIGLETAGGNSSGWTYTWDNGQGNVPSFTYKASNDGTQPQSETIKLTAVNQSVLGKMLGRYDRTYQITVWPKPVFEGSETKEPVTCSGRNNQLSVNAHGGIPREWSYEWKKNGSPVVNNSPLYSYIENESEKTVNNYTVHVTYIHEGQKLIDENCSFDVTVWPEPVISKLPASEIMGYYGETKTFEIDFEGGYETEAEETGSGWSYEWYINDVKQEAGKTLTYQVPEAVSNGQQYTLKVCLKNGYKGTIWKQADHLFHVSAWSKGKVTAVETDSIDSAINLTSVRNGSNFKLESDVEGGYDEGWTFSWKHNGTSMPDQHESSLVTRCRDEMSDFRDDEYTLHYANRIDNSVGCEGEITYNLRIWAEARFFDDGIQGPKKVRKNQDFVLSVAEAEGGYAMEPDKNWQYLWSNQKQGSQVVFNEQFSASLNQVAKQTTNVTHYVDVVNYGPSGHVWDTQRYDYMVEVYNQPLTPVKLVRKGDGSSCTFICMSNLTDQQLAAYEYQFVFGYTVDGHDVVFEAPVSKRYVMVPSSEADKIQWVYARWEYMDETIVTSGKRYIDGFADESFNGSSFVTGNRAPSDETGVEDVLSDGDALHFAGNRFVATLSEPVPACLSIYTINGRLLERMTFDSQSSYDESFDSYLENPGIYMVEVIAGKQRIVKKVCVR